MDISVMITTLNRVDELKRTLSKVDALVPAPLEVWVVADGCSDGTVEFLREYYPKVKLIEHEKSQGSVASRSEVMQNVSGDLVLALDDDSYPEQMDALAKLGALFASNPNLAIATFPQRTDEYPHSLEKKNFGIRRQTRTFPNSGACLRVSTYKTLPGFEPMFFHMYEEPDYALQCIGNNWDVIIYPEIIIRHHYSGLARSERRNHHRHARNEFWSTLMRCPFPHCIPIMLYRMFSQARYAYSRGWYWLLLEPVWWWQAIAGVFPALDRRKSLSWAGYRRWLLMPHR
ncbi:hypothetical protein NT6N_26840 [Oceaniferula spumae]|uniref:Glycosyltransferase 2-like domain-containing protein n=1 Tax=Oceaniferula spumae TaxID=2979115 RepID=A0AAT9FNS3_9BACT